MWDLHISTSISKRIFRESLLALWSVGLTYRDVSIYYRNAIYKLQQQLHSLCVCLSVCVCVVLNEISAENPLDKSEALNLQELLGMRVNGCVCMGVCVSVCVCLWWCK